MITARQAAETSEKSRKKIMDKYLNEIEKNLDSWIRNASSSGKSRVEFTSRDFNVPPHLFKLFTAALKESLEPGKFKLEISLPRLSGESVSYVVRWECEREVWQNEG